MLDWEDALPEDELTASENAAAEADLAICLGTSLQITPACNIPLKTTKAGKRLDKPLCSHTNVAAISGLAVADLHFRLVTSVSAQKRAQAMQRLLDALHVLIACCMDAFMR